ncbi:MAG: zincin-like metallopeptidase domain-containing protein, partial [Gammaproteobacteria bacterium]|nr:zincin-like metallopeptidase domain-containing protein [Gammaproteobacteria bacterium]
DRAYYHMKRDEIVLPERGQFPSANHYYQTALHELGHSTGHKDRMNRETLIEGIDGGFGSPQYAREELRAEISAMMTGERVGVGHDPSRGAAYVEGWVKALEEDPREIRRAAADAQKISDYVLARHIEREPARAPVDTTREPMAVAATRAPGFQRIQVPVPQIPTPQRGAGPSR